MESNITPSQKFIHGHARIASDDLKHIVKSNYDLEHTLCGQDVTLLARGLTNATCESCRSIYLDTPQPYMIEFAPINFGSIPKYPEIEGYKIYRQECYTLGNRMMCIDALMVDLSLNDIDRLGLRTTTQDIFGYLSYVPRRLKLDSTSEFWDKVADTYR